MYRLVLVFEIIIEDFYFSKETDITLLLAQNLLPHFCSLKDIALHFP